MKICLGTVQFGLNYGIEKKRIDIDEVEKILKFSLKNNITILDTASGYGDSEIIIGNFNSHKFNIISKLDSKKLKNKNDIKELETEIEVSLKKLKTDFLDGYLLHQAEDLKNEELINNLYCLKEKGLIRHVGVSVYSVEEAELALKNNKIEYIQVPYNILDTRLDKINFFVKAKKLGKIIFVRSVFLQGVLLKPHNIYPKSLNELKQYDNILNEEIMRIGCTKIEYLLNFIKYNKNIDYIILGIDNLENLKEIVNCYSSNKLEKYNFENIRRKFSKLPDKILNPSLWKE
ncbi:MULTISPECIES: aldo/keto reductase [Fusobacterium]|uniref:aldo/keto reductase n=1 Tax=Fusobacterium TaxID=848 RepID=UPI0008A2EADB|nr:MULTISPECIES: aldo/keto reductase [Fusobacterium]OFL80718.1 oxidoreductase [Fusobacterium sp. HMSC073F01]